MTKVVKAILSRGLLESINGFHRTRAASFPLLRHATFRKLTGDARVHSVDSELVTSRQEENHSMHETKDVCRVLDQFERICESDDFTRITLHPVMQDCIRLLPYLRKGECVRLIGILLRLKEKFDDLYDCDDNIIRMSEHLDGILCDWLTQPEPDQVLNVLRMSKILAGHREFAIAVVKKMKKVLTWPTAPMLQYVQYVNENHFWNIYYVDRYSLEYTLSQNLPHLNMDQTAIILRALNELKVDVTSPDLPRGVFELFLEHHASAEPSTISVFLKFFSRLVPCFWVRTFNIHPLLPDLMNVMNQQVDSWPLDSLVHFASFCRRIVCYDEVFFEKLIRRMVSDEVLRLKPNLLDELVMAVVYFNGSAHHTDNLARFVQLLTVEPLHSCLMTHPKRLVSVVNNLSKAGVYDDYFLEMIFSKGFLLETYKKLSPYHVSVNVYSLDQNVQAEHREYSGRRLDEKLRRRLDEKLRQRLDEKLRRLFERMGYTRVSRFESSDDRCWRQASAHERLVHEMRPILLGLLGDECVHVCHLHPHLPGANFVFAMKDGVPQKLSEKLRASHRLLPAELEREYDWYTFKFLTLNTLPPHEPLLLYNGINSARLQTLMGINSISFVGETWKGMAEGEKITHLRKLIFAKS